MTFALLPLAMLSLMSRSADGTSTTHVQEGQGVVVAGQVSALAPGCDLMVLQFGLQFGSLVTAAVNNSVEPRSVILASPSTANETRKLLFSETRPGRHPCLLLALLLGERSASHLRVALDLATQGSKVDLVIALVVTEDPSLVSTFHKRKAKLRFDAHLFTAEYGGNNSTTGNVVEAYLSKDDPRWKQLSVCHLVLRPWIFPERDPEGNPIGHDAEMFALLGERLSLKVEFVLGKNFGDLIAKVGKGIVDVAICGVSLSYHRSLVAEYAHPTFVNNMVIVAPKPRLVSSTWTVIYPFDAFTWSGLAMTLLMVAVGVALTKIILAKWVDSFDVLMVTTSNLISVSVPYWKYSIRSAWQGYMLLMIWVPCTALLAMAYKSNLKACLISVSQEKPVENFQDVVDREMVVAVPEGTIFTRLMRDSVRPSVQEAYQKGVIEKKGYYSGWIGDYPERIRRLKEEGKAVEIVESASAIGRRHLFRVARESLAELFHAYAFSWRHPALPGVNRILRRLTDTGVMRGMHDRYEWRMAEKEREHKRGLPAVQKDTKLTLSHLQLTWRLLGLGLGLAALAFAAVEPLLVFVAGRNRKPSDMVWQ